MKVKKTTRKDLENAVKKQKREENSRPLKKGSTELTKFVEELMKKEKMKMI